MGVLPSVSQIVFIANEGIKTVEIDAATAQNYPTSLAIQQLRITGQNTLFLNRVGTNVALELGLGSSSQWGYLSVSDGGVLINHDSALVSNFADIRGRFSQDGGLAQLEVLSIHHGEFQLQAGSVIAGQLYVGLGGTLLHQSGAVTATRHSDVHGGEYHLYGGDLHTYQGFTLSGISDQDGMFFQRGGSHSSGHLTLVTYEGNGGADYFLEGGVLATGNLSLGSRGKFTQTRGAVYVTDTLHVGGSYNERPRGNRVDGSRGYHLTEGTVSAQKLVLFGSGAAFVQDGGTASVAGTLFLNVGIGASTGLLQLNGGTFACSQATHAGAGADILLKDGTFIVTNLFSYGGNSRPNGARPRFTVQEGSFFAQSIDLSTHMEIGSSATPSRIQNPGYFKMSGGQLTIGNAHEQLGRFILASNGVIDLGPGDAKLSFANSSAERWRYSSLIVTNWNGSPSGGGSDQLKFGSDASGLSPLQLRRIRFENPVGMPAGVYGASMLSSGEVVPAGTPGHLHSVLWRRNNGQLARSLYDGTEFLNGSAVSHGKPVGASWELAGRADFNGDGEKDLLWRHQNGKLGLWLMNGDTVLESVPFQGGKRVAADWSLSGVGDFSSDHKPDLVWRHKDGRVAVWTVYSTNDMDAKILFDGRPVNRGAALVAVADFDRDSNPDLVWQSRTNLSVWRMNGTTLIEKISVNHSLDIGRWRICGVEDGDGDGQKDFFLRDGANRLAVWIMNDHQRRSAHLLEAGLPAPREWRPSAILDE